MEKKQGFFSALKEEVKRGLSPARSRGKSPARNSSPSRPNGSFSLIPRIKKSSKHHHHQTFDQLAEPIIARSGSLRPVGEALAPLIEGPDPDFSGEIGEDSRREGWGHWVRGQLGRTPSMASGPASGSSYRRSDLRLLLGVMGAPLAPIRVNSLDPLPHLSIKSTPIV